MTSGTRERTMPARFLTLVDLSRLLLKKDHIGGLGNMNDESTNGVLFCRSNI